MRMGALRRGIGDTDPPVAIDRAAAGAHLCPGRVADSARRHRRERVPGHDDRAADRDLGRPVHGRLAVGPLGLRRHCRSGRPRCRGASDLPVAGADTDGVVMAGRRSNGRPRTGGLGRHCELDLHHGAPWRLDGTRHSRAHLRSVRRPRESAGASIPVFVGLATGLATGLIVLWFVNELLLRPMLEDVSAWLPADFAPVRSSMRLRAKALTPRPSRRQLSRWSCARRSTRSTT